MIELKKALKDLAANEKLKLYFWYSEKGLKGKPTILASKEKDPKKDKDLNGVLENPGFKLNAQGKMKFDRAKHTLQLAPKGPAPSSLSRMALTAVTIAQSGVEVEEVVIGKLEEESESAGEPSGAETPATKDTGALPGALKEFKEKETANKLQETTARLLKTANYGARQAPDEGVRILKNVEQQMQSADKDFTQQFPGSKLRPASEISQVLDAVTKNVASLRKSALQGVMENCKQWLLLAKGPLKKPDAAPTDPTAIKERAELLLHHINEVEVGIKLDRAMLKRLGDTSQEPALSVVEKQLVGWRAELESLSPKRTPKAELKELKVDSSRPSPSGVKDPKGWKQACDQVEQDIKAGKKPKPEQVEAMTKGAEEALAANKKWNWEKDLGAKFGYDWNKVKAHYKTLQKEKGAEEAKEFISGYWWFRKVTVDRAMKKLADEFKFEWESVGSTNPESDYDISVKTHGVKGKDPYYDWQIVADFNRTISARFGGVQPGTLFDTNLYASALPPERKSEKEKTPVEKDMDAMTEMGQDVGALMKTRRYMDWEEYNDYQEEVLGGLRKAIAKAEGEKKEQLQARLELTTHQFEEAESLYFLSLLKTLQKAKVPIPEKGTANTVEGQKMLIDLVEELEKNPDKLMAATNDAYVEAMTEVRKIEKAIQDEDAKGAAANQEKRSALLAKLKTVQTDAVFFAAEAYHSEGPFKHVVQGLQKGDKEVLKNLPLTEFMQSFNEQLGDFLKDLRHYEHKSPFPGLGFYRSSKYLERLCDAMGHIEAKLAEAKSEVADDFKAIKINGQSPAQIKAALKPLVDIRGGKVEFTGVAPDQQQQEAEAFAMAEAQKIFGSDVKTLRDLGQKIKATGVKVNSLLRRAEAGQKMIAKDERPYFK